VASTTSKRTPASLTLDSPVTELRGVGPRIRNKLDRLGLNVIADLLFYMPRRYIDRTRLTPIGSLRPGTSAQVEGLIELTQLKYGKRRSLLFRISDGTGALTIRLFYFSRSQQNRLQRGMKIRCYGQVRFGTSTFEMIHPEYQLLENNETVAVDESLTPVYPTTEGLQQSTLRKLTRQSIEVLKRTERGLNELLPDDLLNEFTLPELQAAITYVHQPPPDARINELLAGTHPAQQRLAFEELLAQYLSLQRLRQATRARPAIALVAKENLSDRFLQCLPFTLTNAQTSALAEISKDLGKNQPMLRLLQGDVGSGKTVVAALAALRAIESGYQAAIMAPTELLAEQHFKNLKDWFSDMDIEVLLFTGKLRQAEKQERLNILSSNHRCIAIGTHALFQESMAFAALGLVIIDEQHRFGVHQRLALLEKGKQGDTVPHQLIMTATPIPRTLAMTMYADLDITVIDELPPGRQSITTVAIPSSRRDEIIERIEKACHEQRQVYWVCTLIEESEALQCEAAVDTCDYLANCLPGISVGLIHGRMKASEKEQAMAAFKSGEIQLLVATTVIEVGVDVPNASLMIIENAERLGLFQLHQLRGRIGRGNKKSDCVLMYLPPLSETARVRLDTMRQTNNGFEIARKDLEIRGPGEMMGTRQTGLPELRIADLMRDSRLLPKVHSAASKLLNDYPDRIPALIQRWLGPATRYTKV
jgi:ATP-dependent DNA helicase RecG